MRPYGKPGSPFCDCCGSCTKISRARENREAEREIDEQTASLSPDEIEWLRAYVRGDIMRDAGLDRAKRGLGRALDGLLRSNDLLRVSHFAVDQLAREPGWRGKFHAQISEAVVEHLVDYLPDSTAAKDPR